MTEQKTIPAILISPPQPQTFGAISKRYPVELLPVLGKPFLSRTLELLASLGISHVTVYAGTFAAQFEEFIHEGARWGLTVEVVDMSSVEEALKRLSAQNIPCLLGSTQQVPDLATEYLKLEPDRPNLRFSSDLSSLSWGLINQWPANGAPTMEMFFDSHDFVDMQTENPCLMIETPNALVQAAKDLLSGRRPGLLIDGSNAEPEIYIGHNAVIHPTVMVNPPVFLGSDVTIGRGVRLGPFAAVESSSIIDELTTVESSVIMPGTYVGGHLELDKALVDRNYLVYCDAGDIVPVADSFLIGPSQDGPSFSMLSLLMRLVTVLIAIGCLPVFLLLCLLGVCLGSKAPIRAIDAVRLPAPEDPQLWQTFRHYEFSREGAPIWRWLMGYWPLRGIPSLINVIGGQVSWVGVLPREAGELASLPNDWQQLLLTGKNGIIRLAELDRIRTHDDSVEQTYSSEAFYVATCTLKLDVSLFFRALTRWRVSA